MSKERVENKNHDVGRSNKGYEKYLCAFNYRLRTRVCGPREYICNLISHEIF